MIQTPIFIRKLLVHERTGDVPEDAQACLKNASKECGSKGKLQILCGILGRAQLLFQQFSQQE